MISWIPSSSIFFAYLVLILLCLVIWVISYTNGRNPFSLATSTKLSWYFFLKNLKNGFLFLMSTPWLRHWKMNFSWYSKNLLLSSIQVKSLWGSLFKILTFVRIRTESKNVKIFTMVLFFLLIHLSGLSSSIFAVSFELLRDLLQRWIIFII